MTKNEFMMKVTRLRHHFNKIDYACYTCIIVGLFISRKARVEYDRFITIFKDKTYKNVLAEKYSSDKRIVRCMLTEAFFEECLRTGKYEEF